MIAKLPWAMYSTSITEPARRTSLGKDVVDVQDTCTLHLCILLYLSSDSRNAFTILTGAFGRSEGVGPVSYTHLTLPTIYSV